MVADRPVPALRESARGRSARSRETPPELACVAYRTQRAFRAQYGLLVAASMFEEASARLDSPAGAFGRPLRRRLARDVERRRVAFALQLQEFRHETLQLLAPADVIPDVRELVLAYPATPVDTEAGPQARPQAQTVASRLASVALGQPSAYAATAAWAATADELLTRGITNRPSLIIAELTALVLTPIAIFQGPGQAEPDDRTVS
jgi:hypothetical protein